jgi:hypothetical protein
LLAVRAFTDVDESGGAPHRRHEDWADVVAQAEQRHPEMRIRRSVAVGTTLGVLMDPGPDDRGRAA